MKWWLKLYTVPSIICYSKWLILALVIDFMLIQVLGPSTLNLLVYFAPPFMLAHSSTKNSFRANLEFHKMSVPFSVLKKAFFSHLVLLFVFLATSTSIVRIISQIFSGGWALAPQSTFSFYAFGGIIAFIAFLYFNSFHKNAVERYRFYDSKAPLIQRLMLAVFGSIAFIFMTFVLLFMGISAETEMFLLIFSILFGAVLFYSRALFHQTSFFANKKQFFGYWSTGLVGCLSLFFIFAFIGKEDYQNKSLTMDERVQLYFFWQPLTPDLNKDLFMEFEAQLKDPLQLSTLYAGISAKELNEIPVSHFLSRNQPWRLSHYILSPKVNGANRAALLDHMKAQPEWWRKHYKNPQQIQNAIVMNWPKHEPFPERFLKRSMASAPKEAPEEEQQEAQPTEEPQQ